jgi:hypothetical protein
MLATNLVTYGDCTVLTLAALLEKVVSQDPPVLAPSRLPPLKTAVTQYARMLGTTPQQCWPAQYNRPHEERNAFITVHANPTLGSHAVRNLKNNISCNGLQFKRAGTAIQACAGPH